MNTAKLITLGVLRGSGAADPSASFTVTTTGAETLTISGFNVSAPTTVDWGDGSSNVYTSTGTRTHNYAGAGTWTVRILQPLNVTLLILSGPGVPIVLNSADIRGMLNIKTFWSVGLTAGSSGTFNSADISAWRPDSFKLVGVVLGTFNSADVSAWNPTLFNIAFMPAGYTYTFAAADFAGWTATTTLDMNAARLSQGQVDAVLLGMNMAAAGRTVTGGTMTLSGGTNAAPSGTYALECPVTTGNGARHNLLNNGCGTVNAGRVMTTITVT